MHFCIGNLFNFWQYDVGFVPPENAWGTFEVDLTRLDALHADHQYRGREFREGDPAGGTQSACAHDRAPYTMSPDVIQGEFGLDELKLLSSPPVSAESKTWGAIKGLYR
jgi:hypothetical protein